MFVCTVCHRPKACVEQKHYPVRCCGHKHVWPQGWLGDRQLAPVIPTAPYRPRTDCLNRGPMLEEIECPSCCGGKTKIKTFVCSVHGRCTIGHKNGKGILPGIAACEHCTEYAKYAEIQTRNLIYHICPLTSNDAWRANVRQLLQHLDVFNGQRVFAIATGDGLESPAEAMRELSYHSHQYEWFTVPNDRELREVASFIPLLDRVANTNSDEATFYAHTKGNSTAGHQIGAQRWTTMMYRELLGNWQTCMNHLQQFPAVGCNKMCWHDHPIPPYPTRLKHGKWMFSGTFWWVRHDVAFSHPKWRELPADRYAAEAWVSGLIEWWQAKSVFQPWPEHQYPSPSPYDPSLYPAEYDAAWL